METTEINHNLDGISLFHKNFKITKKNISPDILDIEPLFCIMLQAIFCNFDPHGYLNSFLRKKVNTLIFCKKKYRYYKYN